MTGYYFNIQRYCLHDGPGIRTTIFLKGCPLRCVWCHNPESQEREPELIFRSDKCTLCSRCVLLCSARQIRDGKIMFDASKCEKCGRCVDICISKANELCGKRIDSDELVKLAARDKIFHDASGGGITISGGEPAFQSEFTLELIRKSIEIGENVAIETCGFGNNKFFIEASSLGVLFLYDLKAIDSAKHKTLTGFDNKLIIDNLVSLFNIGADIIIRIPLIPGLNDSEEDIKDLSSFLNQYKDKYRYAEIMPYHKLGLTKAQALGKAFDPSIPDGKDFIPDWKKIFNKYGVDIKISI